jgi:hypothetical protein
MTGEEVSGSLVVFLNLAGIWKISPESRNLAGIWKNLPETADAGSESETAEFHCSGLFARIWNY